MRRIHRACRRAALRRRDLLGLLGASLFLVPRGVSAKFGSIFRGGAETSVPPGSLAFPILAFSEWNAFTPTNATFGASPTATGQVVIGTVTFASIWEADGGPAPVNGSVTMQWLLDDVPITAYLVGPPFTLTWDSTSTPDGTHVIGARWIDSTDSRWPAYTLRTVPMTILVQNSGPHNGAQLVPSTGQPFGNHPPFPPATVDYINYSGSPTHNTVHPYTPASAAASSSPSLRLSSAWYVEAINDTRTALYELRPRWSTTLSGGIFINQYYAQFGDTIPSGYEGAIRRLGWDGGRDDNIVDVYSTVVPAPDGAWTGVEISGRVWHMDLTGNVTTLAGPKQNRALLPLDWQNLDTTEGQIASFATIVGTVSGFGDFGGAGDLCYDPRNSSIIYVCKTFDNCIIKINLAGGPAATLYAGQDGVAGFADGAALSALFDQPYSIAMATDGTMYVSDYGNSRIRKITPDGATVSTLVGIQPVPSQAVVAANVDSYSSSTPVAFASAYTAYPGPIRFDSLGDLILDEPHTSCVRLVNLGTQVISRIARWQPGGQGSPVALWQWMAVDTAGTCGPVDDIMVMQSAGGTGQNQNFWRLSHDGSYSAQFNDEGGKLSDAPQPFGPCDNHYPWMLAFSRTEARMLSSGFGTNGWSQWRPHLPSDPPFDYVNGVGISPVLLDAGKAIAKTGTVPSFPFGSRPSFQLLFGSGGAGHLGAGIIPTFDDIATLYPTDAALTTFIQAGMGGTVPRPEITGNDLRNLIYFIRRTALSGGLPTIVPPGPDNPDTTPPNVNNVTATRLSPTSIRVTWNTDKPTIGLAAAGSPNAAATPTRYNVWSPIEAGYGTSHNVTITGLPTLLPTHFCVLAKDIAGNAVNSPDQIAPGSSLSLSPTPPISIPNWTPLGAIITKITVQTPGFSGTLNFVAPNFDDGGRFALSQIDATNWWLIVNPAGPGVGPDGGSTDNITLQAIP